MALLLAGVAINVFKLVVGFEVQANEMETTWTQSMIDTLRASYPNKNAMVCHVASVQELANATHTHYELPLYDFGINTGRTQGFEIYVFDSGLFIREGDGGLSNWCFSGHYKRGKGKFENHVTFFPIPGNRPPMPPPKIHPPPSKTPPNPIRSHPDGVYFVNCQRGNEISSGLAYYRNMNPGANDGRRPDAYVDVSHGSFITWENAGEGTFKDKTVFHWDIIGLAPEKPVLSYCGVADNTYHQFGIYKDNQRVLYEIDGWKCSTIYWCF